MSSDTKPCKEKYHQTCISKQSCFHQECEFGVSKKLAKWGVVIVVSNEHWTEMRDGLCTCRAAHSQMCADKGRGKGR